MELAIVLLLLLPFVINGALMDTGPIISVAPVETVGCYGGISTFYCASDRRDILTMQWQINGNTLNNNSIAKHEVSFTMNISMEYSFSHFHIIGKSLNHYLVIGCIIATYNSSTEVYDVETKSAYFKVSDIPPVEELDLNYEGSLLTVSWSPPSCLPVNYLYVIVIDATDNNMTIYSGNTTELLYSVNVPNCNTNYTASVKVVDSNQLDKESTLAMKSAMNNYETDFTIHQVIKQQMFVSFIDIINCTVFVPLMVNYKTSDSSFNNNCLADSIEILSIVTSIYPSTDVYLQSNNITVLNPNHGEIVNYTFGPFNERFTGQLTLVFPDHTNTSISTVFSTFNIQNFSITIHPFNHVLSLTCYFALYSFADGCQVEFTQLSDGLLTVINKVFIPQSDLMEHTVNMSGITKGNYSINVYDIVEEVKHSIPAYSIDNYHISYYDSTSTSNVLMLMSTLEIHPTIWTTVQDTVHSRSNESLLYASMYSSITHENNSMISSQGTVSTSVTIASVVSGCVILLIGIITVIGLAILCVGIHTKRKKKAGQAEIEFITINSAYERVYPRFFKAEHQPVQSTANPAYDIVKIQQQTATSY